MTVSAATRLAPVPLKIASPDGCITAFGSALGFSSVVIRNGALALEFSAGDLEGVASTHGKERARFIDALKGCLRAYAVQGDPHGFHFPSGVTLRVWPDLLIFVDADGNHESVFTDSDWDGCAETTFWAILSRVATLVSSNFREYNQRR